MKLRLVLALALLCVSASVQAAPTIFLVRHAEKASGPFRRQKRSTALPRRPRPRPLARPVFCATHPFTAVYVTDLQRTQQTVAPLLRQRPLSPTVIPAKDTPALIARLRKAHGNVLVSGHSNTLPEVLRAFGITQPPSIAEADYDNLFILQPGQPARLLRLHY